MSADASDVGTGELPVHVLTSPPSSATPLPQGLLQDLRILLFGETPDQQDVNRWESEAFEWFTTMEDVHVNPNSTPPWILLQSTGGICGVLAPIQAYLIAQCLASPVIDTYNKQPQQQSLFEVEESHMPSILQSTLAKLLVQHARTSAPVNSVTVDSKEPENAAQDSSSVPTDTSNMDNAPPNTSSNDSRLISLVTGTLDNPMRLKLLTEIDVIESLKQNWTSFTSAGGILLYVYSILLTHGIDVIRKEMDDPTVPCIGRFGHCNQELVNLFIYGQAVSNVFDDDKSLAAGSTGTPNESSYILKGIKKHPDIGFLTELEPLRYLTVDSTINNLSEKEKLLMQARILFSAEDTEGNGWITPKTALICFRRLFSDLHTKEHIKRLTIQLDPDKLGIVLWDTFEKTVSRCHQTSRSRPSVSAASTPSQPPRSFESSKSSSQPLASQPSTPTSKILPFFQSLIRPNDSRSTAPSQPMTPKSATLPEWMCMMCTFTNSGLLNKCEMCETPASRPASTTGTEIEAESFPSSISFKAFHVNNLKSGNSQLVGMTITTLPGQDILSFNTGGQSNESGLIAVIHSRWASAQVTFEENKVPSIH